MIESTKQPMSYEEIEGLTDLIRKVWRYITSIKSKNSLANKIQYPPIPSSLSESIALYLLKECGLIDELRNFTFCFGHSNGSDIIARNNDNTIEKKIEVKSTGKPAFQYFSDKDIKADYIIWIHLDNYFMLSKTVEKFKIVIIKKPLSYFEKTVKIKLSKVEKILDDQKAERKRYEIKLKLIEMEMLFVVDYYV